MLLHAEHRRLPAFDVVAFGALTFRGAIRELPVVHIFVAVRAARESQRLFEFASGMASRAIHLDVRAEEREFRF